MNIDPNTLASSLIGVVGQRLVRQICDNCKVAYEPPKQLLREFFDERPRRPEVLQRRGLRARATAPAIAAG